MCIRDRPGLARQLAWQPRCDVWEDEAPLEHVGVLGHQQRRLVIGRDEHRALADPFAEPHDARQQLPGILRTGRRPDERPLQVARERRRRESVLGDRINVDAEASQRADSPDAAVVDRVVADLQEQRRNVSIDVAGDALPLPATLCRGWKDGSQSSH